MKRQYFLHRQNAPLEPSHVIYHVWVGESVKEQRILTQLVAHAYRVGATLMSWGEDIDAYLQLEEERCFPSRGLIDFGFIRADLTAAEALELFEGDKWDSYEKTLSQPKAFFSAIRLNDPSRVAEKSRKISSPSCQPHSRQNLSERYEGQRFIISFI